MKLFFSILLLFITAAYIMPVKEAMSKDGISCVQEADEEKGEKEKNNEKDKVKEWVLFSAHANSCITASLLGTGYRNTTIKERLHMVEVPPPDRA